MSRRAAIAVDLGAESCRVSLLRWVGEEPRLQLVHRLPNGPVRDAEGSLRWPLEQICAAMDAGIARCAALAPEGVASLAVDGWAVDYVRLGEDGTPVAAPYCYRDARHAAAAEQLHGRIGPERLRAITGVEPQTLNTVYQLHADRLAGLMEQRWLQLPEYLLHRWGGEPVAEYTNATHTQLIDVQTRTWSEEIFSAAGLDVRCAPRLVEPGTVVGRLGGPLAQLPGLEDVVLIAPACHDTASAIAGIAETGEDWAYISCGTWSLVGTLLRGPESLAVKRAGNGTWKVTGEITGKVTGLLAGQFTRQFTRLGAVGGATCMHKGMNGMWILKQCMDTWAAAGEPWAIGALLEAAACLDAPENLLDIDDPTLLEMGAMPARVNAQRRAAGLAPLDASSTGAPAMVCLLMHSLAARNAEVLAQVAAHTGKQLRRVVMVGGGAQNGLLRRLIAERSGLAVVSGPCESATIGNFAVQCAVLENGDGGRGAAFAKAVASWAGRLGAVPLEAG
jgi:rhamnulokinase